jgi:aspartate racemase
VAIRDGLSEALAGRLEQAVASLLKAGAQRVLIACVTVHWVLPMLPEPLRRSVVSLLDLTIDELLASGDGPFLLLVTTGTRAARIFENHERWRDIAPRVLLPDERDQSQLQARIYELKAGRSVGTCLEWLGSLRDRYGAAGLVFGCTELHLLQGPIAEGGGEADLGRIIDPLWVAARDLPRILADTP